MAKPVIILVRPQLGENIGKAARAMLNFSLSEMRLVAPRDGWPNPSAGPAAAGAEKVLDQARVCETTEEAIQDLNFVFAATARTRDMPKPSCTPEEALDIMVKKGDERVGILFGPERSGLTNDDVVLADRVLTIPVNPDFPSLNLAVSVGIVARAWFKRAGNKNGRKRQKEETGQATKAELSGLFRHLEGELDKAEYFRPDARKPVMVRTLRNMLQSAGFSSQQVRTLRGVIKALSRRK